MSELPPGISDGDEGQIAWPLVSVIMNCFNSAHYLREAIDSVLAQDYRNWELVFWDNRSTDGSGEIFNSYNDPRLKYFLAPKHAPLYGARNEALKKTEGSLIAFLDCDDRWLPAKLTTQVKHFVTMADTCLIYSNYYVIDGNGVRTSKYFKRAQPSGDVFRAFLKFYPVNIQTVMLKKAVIEEMDEKFDPGMYFSGDYDLFIRLSYGRIVDYLNIPLAEYRIHSNQCSVSLIEKVPEEFERVLQKLEQVVPNFKHDFKEEIAHLSAKNAYLRANSAMTKGARRAAEETLRPFRYHGVFFFALYLLTMLPSGIWIYINRTRRMLGLW